MIPAEIIPAPAEDTRAVVTLALGSRPYWDLAVNLARSFRYWNPDSRVIFQIISDHEWPMPPDLTGIGTRIIPARKYGTGFSPKLWLDEFAPADETLFVDSDCLFFGPVERLFAAFSGKVVGIIGEARTTGHFFGEIEELRSRLEIPWVPAFVGSLYYIRQGPPAAAIFGAARELEKRYDELGLIRLRGFPNEEPLMALALARAGILPLADDGTLKADVMHYEILRHADVLRGGARLEHAVPGKSVPISAEPAIVHFNSHFAEGRHYRREALRLRLVHAHGWPVNLATLIACLRHDWPSRVRDLAKKLMRPVFRTLIGTRRVRTETR